MTLGVARHDTRYTEFNCGRIFTAPCVTFIDSRFEYGELRLITLGLLAGRVVVVAHAPRGEATTRIISMRKANGREQKIYQKRLGED